MLCPSQEYNKNKATLLKLRQKALNKNPDEFHHHMINSNLDDGVHKEKAKDQVLTPEQIALMQTRDLSYIVNKRSIEKKKIEKLKASLHMIDAYDKPVNKHTFFVDSEAEKKRFDPAKALNTHPDMLNRAFNRPKLQDLALGKFEVPEGEVVSEAMKKRQKAYKELHQRIQREKQLGVIQAKMEAKKHLQNKKREKPLRLVKEETKESAPIYCWPTERKK